MGVNHKKIAVFGGTFDPFHNGHLAVIHSALKNLNPDILLVTPAGRPLLKNAPLVASIAQRLAMARLATSTLPKTEISDLDADTRTNSHSVELAEKLKKYYGKSAELIFIAGDDTLYNLAKWHSVEKLVNIVQFAIIKRPGAKELPKDALYFNSRRLEMRDLGFSNVEVSSSELKMKGSNSVLFWENVPRSVRKYAEEHKIYEPR